MNADDEAGSEGSGKRRGDKNQHTEAAVEVLGAEAGRRPSVGSWEALLEAASTAERPAADRVVDMEDSC